jgi:hypothetical protein
MMEFQPAPVVLPDCSRARMAAMSMQLLSASLRIGTMLLDFAASHRSTPMCLDLV